MNLFHVATTSCGGIFDSANIVRAPTNVFANVFANGLAITCLVVKTMLVDDELEV